MINIKKEFRILSYIAIALSTAVFVFLVTGTPGELNNSAQALGKPFDDFPENEPQMVDFRMNDLRFADLTEREKQDQLRDWLLFVVVSDSSFSAAEINQSLYDLSTVRQGYTRPVSDFEYGTVRSRYIGDGEIVALIPAALTPEQRLDSFAAVVDKHRKNLGEKPSRLAVFEYELHTEQQYALLTRQQIVDAESLFSASAGYVETQVSTLEDLQEFMSEVDDLTHAQQQGDSLLLGGRKLRGQSYRGIRVAIWQAEDKIRRDLVDFETRWSAKLSQAAPSERKQLETQAFQEQSELGLVSSSGFSLDPVYDYPAFRKIFTQTISPVLREYVDRGNAPITEAEVQASEVGLANEDAVPYLMLADKLQRFDDPLSQSIGFELEASSRDYTLQKARYDGPLQGTEVGMLLFYTDLLAKLWALDYNASTPKSELADFAPLPEVVSRLASIYWQEQIDLPSTRLWFGPQDKGFQLSASHRLAFARNATQIYAASSDSLKLGEETYASPASDAFLGWWDNHYEEVAVYEPAYEQLNEIMKWSLLIGWLNHDYHGDLLAFLKDVPVQRDLWFPDWARAQGNRLKFQDWENIQFYPKGYLGNETESMPILSSQPYEVFGESGRYISGGVSLADSRLFEGRNVLKNADALNDSSLRSNIDYGSLSTADNLVNFSTLEGITYRLFDEQPTLSAVRTQAKEGHKLRSQVVELANMEFVRSIALTDDGLNISTSIGNTELGRLRTARTGNGFKVGWRGSDIDSGQQLVQKLVQSSTQPNEKSFKMLLESEPTLAAAAQANDGSFLLKIQDSDNWMQVASGGGGRDLPPDWQARIGNLPNDSVDSVNYLLRWIDDAQVQKRLASGEAKLFVVNVQTTSTPLAPDDFVNNLKQRNYSEVAAQISENPEEAYVIAQSHIRAELEIIDSLYQSRQVGLALDRLDELIGVYGQQPDLMLKKALLDISRKRLDVTRIDVNGTDWTAVESQEDFYSAVNIAFSGSDDAPRFRAIKTDNKVFYIQDSPGLNNIDPTLPIEDASFFGSETRAYRLESGSISDSHIGSNGYDEPVAALPFGSGSSEPSSSAANSTSFRTSGSALTDRECKEQKINGKIVRCDHDVYVVVENPQ
jgi:hypothetical protein